MSKSSTGKIITRDSEGRVNGWLMELQKRGETTTAYLTTVDGFKGFHLHRIRVANYICIRGMVRVEMYHWEGQWRKEEVILTEGKKLTIPVNVPTGLRNIGGEAWIINFPEPAYDPEVKEQVEYTREELLKGVVK